MTSHYVVFGNPIEHSLSPDIHAYFAKQCAQDLTYGRIKVPEGQFASLATKMFNEGLCGCNITVPCKHDAFALANKLTSYAQDAQAVNTLKRLDDGTLLGDNTDGRGLVADLERLGCEIAGKNILIVGAGGACCGIVRPLLEKNPKSLAIVNRNELKAFEIAQKHEGVCVVLYSNLKAQYDIIINATSASLKGLLPPIADDVIAHASWIYDLMYKSDGDTIFISHAKALGVANCHDGLGMLLGQAALSFELWRGVRPNLHEAYLEFAKRCGRNA